MGFLGFSNYIGIDLGTTSTLIYTKRKGIVLRESSVIAVRNDANKKLLLAGDDAKQMMGKTAKNTLTIKPLKDGVIADIEMAPRMLKSFIKKAFRRVFMMKLDVVLCYPTGITQLEKIAIEETAYRAGANKVYLIPKPLAAAIGAGLPVGKPVGNIIVDIGGGTTDIAIVSSGDVVLGKSLRIAGDEMDQAIISHIKREYKLVISERTAEQIKIEIGSAFPEETERTMEIHGKDLLSGLPKLSVITSKEINESLNDSINSIINGLKSILEMAPPELSSDIVNNGIILIGGGALLNGFDKLLKKETGLPVNIADNPLDCVAIGAGKALDNIKSFKLTNSLTLSKRYKNQI